MLSSHKVGDTRGTGLGLLIQVIGYFVVILTVLGLLGQDVSALLVGGAITGVVIGIAAQQTMANLFAGMVLVTVRPMEIGEHVVLRSGPLAGEYEGVVTDLGLFYVDMVTAQGPVKLPERGGCSRPRLVRAHGLRKTKRKKSKRRSIKDRPLPPRAVRDEFHFADTARRSSEKSQRHSNQSKPCAPCG